VAQDLLDTSTDTIADHGTADTLAGRDGEPITPELVAPDTDRHQRVASAASS